MQKNGRRAGSPATGGLRAQPRAFGTASLRPVVRVTLDTRLLLADGREGRAGQSGHAGALWAVSPVWLPPYPGLPGAAWIADER
jgi:hypothetical protein